VFKFTSLFLLIALGLGLNSSKTSQLIGIWDSEQEGIVYKITFNPKGELLAQLISRDWYLNPGSVSGLTSFPPAPATYHEEYDAYCIDFWGNSCNRTLQFNERDGTLKIEIDPENAGRTDGFYIYSGEEFTARRIQ